MTVTSEEIAALVEFCVCETDRREESFGQDEPEFERYVIPARAAAATAEKLLEEIGRPQKEEALPCDVLLPPCTIIRKGCGFDTLRVAISQRAKEGWENSFNRKFELLAALARDAAPWPAALSEPLSEVLGLMNFQTGPIAHVYRAAGHTIPTKCEDEQAFVLHRFVGLALTHGADWKKFAREDLQKTQSAALDRMEKDEASDG